MRANEIYAIVDIEATGGSIGADERIIQFACVLFKNNKVINRFDTLVNPNKRIPTAIEKLTGIKNKDVTDAPYFEEIAPMILSLLENAIFVAHNVGFDYRLAIESVAAGVDKVRTNPGNIGSDDKVKAVVNACKGAGVPIRIGVNSGSLEKNILLMLWQFLIMAT